MSFIGTEALARCGGWSEGGLRGGWGGFSPLRRKMSHFLRHDPFSPGPLGTVTRVRNRTGARHASSYGEFSSLSRLFPTFILMERWMVGRDQISKLSYTPPHPFLGHPFRRFQYTRRLYPILMMMIMRHLYGAHAWNDGVSNIRLSGWKCVCKVWIVPKNDMCARENSSISVGKAMPFVSCRWVGKIKYLIDPFVNYDLFSTIESFQMIYQ